MTARKVALLLIAAGLSPPTRPRKPTGLLTLRRSRRATRRLFAVPTVRARVRAAAPLAAGRARSGAGAD